METAEFVRPETDWLVDLQAAIEGHVFHVTRRQYWPQILASGAIEPNKDGRFQTTFGNYSSFFRNRGCVSLFDYRVPPDEEIHNFRRHCWPFQPAKPGDDGIAILILNPSIYSALISWERWKSEEVWREVAPLGETTG